MHTKIKSNQAHIISYRPDIDGLRALAITLVVLVHAFPENMPNGFIGVDIFFVISGFLISSILLTQLQAGSFNLLDFYIRRANRIFPALVLVLAACICFGWLALYASEYKSLGASIAAGAGFVANINFYLEAGYWDISSKLKPLLHLWSLGIEEQFYLLWPVLLWATWTRRFNVVTVCIVIIVLSLSWNLVSIGTDQVATFYLPFARFWELLTGGVLACANALLPAKDSNASVPQNSLLHRIIYRDMPAPTPKMLNNGFAVLGISLIAAALAERYPSHEFPGKHAIMPVFGTALIILAGSQAWINSRLLSNRCVVYIGLISFPLYLWHWPLLTFARILENGELSDRSRNAAVFLAVILAIATYHLLEKPLRSNPVGRGLKAITLTVLLAACGTFGYYIQAHDGLEARYPQPPQPDTSALAYTVPKVTKTSKVVLLGDSNAGHFINGLFPIYKDSLIYTTVLSGWPYLVGTAYRHDFVPRKEHVGTPKITEEAISRITADPSIDVVIISNSYEHYFPGDILRSYPTPLPGETTAMAYEAGLRRTVKTLADAGKHVIVVKSIPYLKKVSNVMACAASSLPIQRSLPEGCKVLKEDVQKRRISYDLTVSRALADYPEVAVFDTLAYLCDEHYCYVNKDGILMYSDAGHLSDEGSKLLGAGLAKLVEIKGAQRNNLTAVTPAAPDNGAYITPADLNNSAYIGALMNSGDTNLSIPLSANDSPGGATGSRIWNVPTNFTISFSNGAVGDHYVAGAISNLSVDNPGINAGSSAMTADTQAQAAAVGSTNSFQQIYSVDIQGYSPDYTLTSLNGTASLTNKSSGQVVKLNVPQPGPGANYRGIDVKFLDGSLSVTGKTDNKGVWTAYLTKGVVKGGDLGAWLNSNAQPLPATGIGQPLDLSRAEIQNSLLNSADHTQQVGFYGGTSLGLLPATVTTINDSTPKAMLTGILGGETPTFMSGDSIALNGGGTLLTLFDFVGGTPLPANIAVSNINTLNLAGNAGIGSAGLADDFSTWKGLTTINAMVSGAGSSAGDNGLINLIAGNGTAVNLIANDTYSSTKGIDATTGAITVRGGSQINITQNLDTLDDSPISSGGITINGGSATIGTTVKQSAAVPSKVGYGPVTINDVSANSSNLNGSLSTVTLINYGNGSIINDNALSFLSLSGAGGTLTLNNSKVSAPVTVLNLTLSGLNSANDNTITDRHSEITTLNVTTTGATPSTLSGFVDSRLTAINVQGASALTLLNPPANLSNYSVIGKTASLTVAAHSGAGEDKVTLKGAVAFTTTADAVSTGITVAAGSDDSNISFTTTGALDSGKTNTFTLGNGNNTISDIVPNTTSTTIITVGTGSNQISTGSNTVNITLGKHAAGAVDSISVGANSSGSLKVLTMIAGAQQGDKITFNNAARFINTPVTATQVVASGGDVTKLADWVNAALSAQGANLPGHALGWFNFGGNTYLIAQANNQGSAFAAGDTLVKLVGTLNVGAASCSGHTLTL